MNAKDKQAEITEALKHFHGSAEIYKASPLFPGFCISEGVRYLRREAECFWLIDEIAAFQVHPKVKNHPRLREEQFWSLDVREDRTARLVCEWDSGKVVIQKDISFTNFPLSKIRIWVTRGQFQDGKGYILAYLPSER